MGYGHWCAPPPGSPVFGHPMRRSRTTLGIPSTTRRRSSPTTLSGGSVPCSRWRPDPPRSNWRRSPRPHLPGRSRRQSARHHVRCRGRPSDRRCEIHPDTSVHAVYPCAGDDEWCVISIRSDDEWRRATSVFGQPELANDPRFGASRSRVANRSELVAAVSAWTSTRTPVQAAGALQAAGVAAGPMNRPSISSRIPS